MLAIHCDFAQFHVVGLDRHGAIVLRQKWSRGQVEARLANLPPCLIGMEACVGAHYLCRKLTSLGHDARLMPAKYVRPYSRGQKNDFRDAEAIAEAVQRPTMKFVATKTAEQLDLQALHRVRERLVSQRTGIINQIRAGAAAKKHRYSITSSAATCKLCGTVRPSALAVLRLMISSNFVSTGRSAGCAPLRIFGSRSGRPALAAYGKVCGWTLARADARSRGS
jgi:hypothetical protein